MITGDDSQYNCVYIISEISRKNLCIEKSKWKLTVNYENGSKELYDLSRDIEEKNNLVTKESGVIEELETIIKRHLEKNRQEKLIKDRKLENHEIEDRLKALGYI